MFPAALKIYGYQLELFNKIATGPVIFVKGRQLGLSIWCEQLRIATEINKKY